MLFLLVTSLNVLCEVNFVSVGIREAVECGFERADVGVRKPGFKS